MAERRKKNWWKSILEDTKSIRQFLWSVLMFPVRVLFLPLKLIGLFHAPEAKDTDQKYRLPLSKRLWNLAVRTAQAPFVGMASFFRGLWRTVLRMGWKDWMFVSPILAMGIFLFFVFGTTLFRTEAIENKYHVQARQAYDRGDFPLARSYFERFKQDNQLTQVQEFFWAQILSKTGENESAQEIIDSLAPLDEAGFSQAHLIKAMNLAATFKRQPDAVMKQDPQALKKLRWHLENCDNQTPVVMEARAMMHALSGETDEAIQCLSLSAKKAPAHYLMMADICHRSKLTEQRDAALAEAESIFAARVEKDSLDITSRLLLAQALIKQSKFREAHRIFQDGMKLTPEPKLRDAYASFFLLQFNLLSKQKDVDLDEQLSLLNLALEVHADKGNAIVRKIIVLYQKAKQKSPATATQLREKLLSMVAVQESAMLAHVALSEVCTLEGQTDKAMFHLESALRIDPEMPLVANNLAWQLSQQTSPDLPRALKLAQLAVKQAPNNPQIRDTLGTILIQMKQFEEAVPELQRALRGMSQNASLHKKLAQALDHLEMDGLAESHRKKAHELEAAN